jgi:hypothetical protein
MVTARSARPDAKVSRPIANIANVVHDHVARTWPEIASLGLDGVWFTGSRIWWLLYPDLLPARVPSLEVDWDIFALREPQAQALARIMRWNRMPACRTRDKWTKDARVAAEDMVPRGVGRRDRDLVYDEGCSYATDRGVVDLWIAASGDVATEIRDYPTESHAHCRAAFSFRGGLIVLPNERAIAAREQGNR